MAGGEAIWGNKLVPGLADRFLARTPIDGQQTSEPISSDRPDNLFAPVAGEHGAHGEFDARARPSSRQWWVTTHRGLLLALVAALVAVALLAWSAA